MKKMLNYLCAELDDLEKRLDSGNLTMSDIKYGDILAHFKKSLLMIEGMENRGHSSRSSYDDYSYDDGSYDGSYDDYSYDDYSGRGSGADGMSNRMSRRMSRDDAKKSLMRHLRGIEKNSNDEEVKRTIRQWLRESGE